MAFLHQPYPATYSQQAIEFTRKLDDGRQPELWNEAAACLHQLATLVRQAFKRVRRVMTLLEMEAVEEQRQRRVGRCTK